MIRRATQEDVPHLLRCITALARYERLEHQLELDAGRLRDFLFAPGATAFAIVAEAESQAVGFALCIEAFSTFACRRFVHLEDLFVFDDWRGKGHGLALLRAVAREAVRRGCRRVGWNVLDWNEPAIAFYRGLGADVLPDWRTCRLSGDALARMADESDLGDGAAIGAVAP